MSKILVTGVAGFIGYHVCQRLLERGDTLVGLDNLNEYYDVRIKRDRLAMLTPHPRFAFRRLDLADRSGIHNLFEETRPELVVNLAAQAGVRYSLENPYAYTDSNVLGFLNVLEGCRRYPVQHLVYASSSSVYGSNRRLPFSVHDNVDHPLNMYAASKKANELMAHTYSHLYQIPTTGLRFFSVYGPWGRPDMALFIFTQKILAQQPIEVYNCGDMLRDFTYIDDIVEGVVRLLDRPPSGDPAWSPEQPDPGSSAAPYRLYNIGHSEPVQLMHFINVLESCLGMEAVKVMLPMQPGDVRATYADIADLEAETGYHPSTPVEVGIDRFVRWYREYYGV